MLVALFSALEDAVGAPDLVRAYLPIAGRTILFDQIDLALEMGAERVVVFAHGLPDELVEIQHQVERRGVRFHAIAGTRPLAGLLTSADDILLFADGILPDRDTVRLALGTKREILALPAEPAVREGYERIDRDRAWAGVLRSGGSDAAHLADMPADIDPISALLRVAAQAGRPIEVMPSAKLADGQWRLVRSREEALEASRQSAMRSLGRTSWWAPFHALADRAALSRASGLPARLSQRRGLTIAAIVAAMISLVLGWYGWTTTAIVALGLATFAALAAHAFARMTRRTETRRATLWKIPINALFDLALLALLAWGTSPYAWREMLFALLVLLGLLRLCEAKAVEWISGPGRDRVLLAVLLAIAAVLGVLALAIEGIALVLLLLLLSEGLVARLTRA